MRLMFATMMHGVYQAKVYGKNRYGEYEVKTYNQNATGRAHLVGHCYTTDLDDACHTALAEAHDMNMRKDLP